MKKMFKKSQKVKIFILENLFENNNKEQNKNDEACEEIENFCNNKYSPDKKEKFLNYYLSLICNDCLLSKKYNEKNNLDV